MMRFSNSFKFFSCLSILAAAQVLPALSQGLTGPPVWPRGDAPPYEPYPTYAPQIAEALERSYSVLIGYSKLPLNPSLVTFCIDKSGLVSLDTFYIDKTAGTVEGEFACIDAIEGASPFPSPYPSSTLQYIEKMPFYGKEPSDPRALPDRHTIATESYFAANPDAVGKVVVMRAIPSDACRRYPGTFSESDLNCADNLRGLKISALNWQPELKVHAHTASRLLKDPLLREMCTSWPKFFLQHPQLTRDELTAERAQFDAKYGALFYHETLPHASLNNSEPLVIECNKRVYPK